jgi:hypothetical protein
MATGYSILIHFLRSILVMIALYGRNLASSSFFRQILMDHRDYRAGWTNSWIYQADNKRFSKKVRPGFLLAFAGPGLLREDNSGATICYGKLVWV